MPNYCKLPLQIKLSKGPIGQTHKKRIDTITIMIYLPNHKLALIYAIICHANVIKRICVKADDSLANIVIVQGIRARGKLLIC